MRAEQASDTFRHSCSSIDGGSKEGRASRQEAAISWTAAARKVGASAVHRGPFTLFPP